MKKHLQLKEIVWEITGKCNNRCTFCGSKDAWNDPRDEGKILEIAERIAAFPPSEIDISGGDPLLVSFETHKKVTDLLKGKGVKCKILVNPRSLDKMYRQAATDIIHLYDYWGVSINSKEDISSILNWDLNNATVITNFNLDNIFSFDLIKDFVKKINRPWMIQLTVYKEKDHPLALYKKEEAFAHLVKLIQEAADEGLKIIVSDNMNTSPCTAGLHSLGILWDGTVVPCLSMRSWLRDQDLKETMSCGNIFDESLESIWEGGFNHVRHCDFLCCKDHCGKSVMPAIPLPKPKTTLWPELPKGIAPVEPITAYYMVQSYPLWPPQDWQKMEVRAYAVSQYPFPGGVTSGTSIVTTTSGLGAYVSVNGSIINPETDC